MCIKFNYIITSLCLAHRRHPVNIWWIINKWTRHWARESAVTALILHTGCKMFQQNWEQVICVCVYSCKQCFFKKFSFYWKKRSHNLMNFHNKNIWRHIYSRILTLTLSGIWGFIIFLFLLFGVFKIFYNIFFFNQGIENKYCFWKP